MKYTAKYITNKCCHNMAVVEYESDSEMWDNSTIILSVKCSECKKEIYRTTMD